jgi:hypothetical protein
VTRRSGSTLIACEKTAAQAANGTDPKYVDVIVERWQDFTGESAALKTMAGLEQVKTERRCSQQPTWRPRLNPCRTEENGRDKGGLRRPRGRSRVPPGQNIDPKIAAQAFSGAFALITKANEGSGNGIPSDLGQVSYHDDFWLKCRADGRDKPD